VITAAWCDLVVKNRTPERCLRLNKHFRQEPVKALTMVASSACSRADGSLLSLGRSRRR
jgi:hypothetical protein